MVSGGAPVGKLLTALHNAPDELIPVGRRGKLVTRGRYAASCAMGHFEDYENASITWTDRCESQGGGVFQVNIRLIKSNIR